MQNYFFVLFFSCAIILVFCDVYFLLSLNANCILAGSFLSQIFRENSSRLHCTYTLRRQFGRISCLKTNIGRPMNWDNILKLHTFLTNYANIEKNVYATKQRRWPNPRYSHNFHRWHFIVFFKFSHLAVPWAVQIPSEQYSAVQLAQNSTVLLRAVPLWCLSNV